MHPSQKPRPMPESWASCLTYPVLIEGAEDKLGKWHVVYEAETQEQFEYRINSYKFPVYPFMRIRTATGETFGVSQEQLLKHNMKATAETNRKTSPLKAFLKSAPEKALETAAELLRAGYAAKHFLIQPKSKLVLGHPDLYAILLHEFTDSVVCKILVEAGPITETEPVVTLWKDNSDGRASARESRADGNGLRAESLANPRPSADTPFGITPEHLHSDVSAFLCLLCASVVRDFWVLETRAVQQKYQKRTEKTRKRDGHGKDRKLVVTKDYTFIPRFQYDLASYQKHPRSISHQARVTLSPHLVSGHLRRLPEGWNASEEQLAQAAEFGIRVGDGQTFVRPHKRGEVEQLRNYRSRSALELLFGQEATDEKAA